MVTAIAILTLTSIGLMAGRTADPPDALSSRGEPGGTGHFPVAGVDGLSEVWRTAAVRGSRHGIPPMQLLAAGSTVVARTDAGLVGVDADDGSLRWRTPLARATGAFVVVEGLLVGSMADTVLAVDPHDGSEVWRTQLDAPEVRLVAAGGSTVVVVGASDEDRADEVVVGIDVEDGRRLWLRHLNEGDIRIAPWVSVGALTASANDDIVVLPTGREVGMEEAAPNGSVEHYTALEAGGLVVLDVRSGEERWRAPSAQWDGYRVDGDLVVLLTDPGTIEPLPGSRPEVVAHDAADGRVRWRAASPRHVGTVTITRHHVHVGGGRTLTRLARDDGREITSFAVPEGVNDAEEVNGHLLLGSWSGLAMVDASDGQVRWEHENRHGGAFTVLDDRVVTATDDGIEALDLASGRGRWNFANRGIGSCDLQGFSGALVAASAGHVLTFDPATGRLTGELTAARTTRSDPTPRRIGGTAMAVLTRIDTAPDDPADGERTDHRLVAAVGPTDHRGPLTVSGWTPTLDEPAWEWEAHRTVPSLLSDGRTVVVVDGDEDLQVTVIAASDGQERWSRAIAHPQDAQRPDRGWWLTRVAAVIDGRLVTVDDRSLASWSLVDGEPQWTTGVGLASEFVAAAASSDVLVVTTSNGVRAIDIRDGTTRWTRRTAPVVPNWHAQADYAGMRGANGHGAGTPVLADGHVLVATDDGVRALDEATGEPRWATTLRSPVVGGLSVAGGRIHAATAAGLELLDLHSGASLAHVETDRLVISAPFLDGERLYVCLADGSIAAYR